MIPSFWRRLYTWPPRVIRAQAVNHKLKVLFYLKRSFETMTPIIFLPLYKVYIRPHFEYAVQASSPILSWGCQALEQDARGDCERFIRGGIQVVTGCTVAVPLPRSSPLTRPTILPPELVPSCRIPPLGYNCNYSWMPTGSPCFPKYPSNPPPLTTHSLTTHRPT